MAYLKIYHKVVIIEDILKKDVPTIESIRRCRQKLQEEGKYPATDKASAKRKSLQNEYKEYFKK